MSRLNLWRMTALVSTGLVIITVVLFLMLGQQYDFVRGIAFQQQTDLDSRADLIIKQGDTIRELRKLLFGNNETEQKPFPPGTPL
jgi:hypothetical protein